MSSKLLDIGVALLLCGTFTSCRAQETYGKDHLVLKKTILLPDVKGRIDHMDINLKDQIVYVAALGNNSLEVVDLVNARVIHSIRGLDEPQGVGYIPQLQEVFVANGGNGECYFFNAHSFEKVATIHLSSDADDVRYDSSERKIYVGYGKGGIAIIDANTHKQVGDIPLPAHPESFQIDKKLNLLFVNLPDAHMVGVIDLSQLRLINKWVRTTPFSNFPMALDAIQHQVFIGYRHPARLIVLDGKTGKEVSMNPMAGDADDLYYDNETKRVLISGGEGYVCIFQEQGTGTYKQVANIKTISGARTSFFSPELRLFAVAARAESGNSAKLLLYHLMR